MWPKGNPFGSISGLPTIRPRFEVATAIWRTDPDACGRLGSARQCLNRLRQYLETFPPNPDENSSKQPSMLRNAPIRAYIPASNMTRVRKFYEEIIGLQPKEEYTGGAIYECGILYWSTPPKRQYGNDSTKPAPWEPVPSWNLTLSRRVLSKPQVVKAEPKARLVPCSSDPNLHLQSPIAGPLHIRR